MPPSGSIVIPQRRYAFFGVTHQWAAGETTIALTAGQTGISDAVIIDSSYDFIAVAHAAIHSSALGTSGQGKLQRQVDRTLLQSAGGGTAGAYYLGGFGSGQWPQYEPRKLRIPGGSNFKITLDDRQAVGSALTARLLHWGYVTLPPAVAQSNPKVYYAAEEDFHYLADFTAEGPNGAAIVANATITLPIAIDSDADFEIRKLVVLCDGECKIQIKNNDTRNLWFNKAVHAWLLGATTMDAKPSAGDQPFLMPCVDEDGQRYYTELLRARGSLSVTVQDLSGFANRVQVLFIGRRLTPARGLLVA